MKPTILLLFNSSLYAAQPWLDDGRFNVVSVDYHDTDHHTDSPQQHRHDGAGHYRINYDLSKPFTVSGLLEILGGPSYKLDYPALCLSFAPCTDLAVSGARHFASKAQANPRFQKVAVTQARLAEQLDCPYAVENPVSVLSTLWRKPDLYWHPRDYAGYCPSGLHPEFPSIIPEQDRYNKKSCLWLGNGFVIPRFITLPVLDEVNPGWAKLGGKSPRTKYIRSLTPRGFANAVYLANREKVLDNAS